MEAVNVYTHPASEPVTVADLKAHAVIEHDADDGLVELYALAARQKIERERGLVFISTVFEWTLSGFPCRPFLTLPRQPLVSIASVTYRDTAGATQTLDPSDYRIRAGKPGFLVLDESAPWPSTTDRPDAVTIRFTAGHATADDVPATLLQALRLVAADFYANRENSAPVELRPIPTGADRLLRLEGWGGYR